MWLSDTVWSREWHVSSRSGMTGYTVRRGGICVPPTVTYLPYRVYGSTLTAVGRSQLLARWPGTRSRILSGIQRAAQTVLGVYLKRTCSRVSLLVHPAHQGFLTIIRYTNPHTHSLTHSLTVNFCIRRPILYFTFTFFSGGVGICYVRPVFWMTSIFRVAFKMSLFDFHCDAMT